MEVINEKMDAAPELGRNPVSKHQIQPEYGDEQADAGRDCRTSLARPNSQTLTRTGKFSFPSSADNVQDWQPYPVDPYSCYVCDHTYVGDKQYRAARQLIALHACKIDSRLFFLIRSSKKET